LEPIPVPLKEEDECPICLELLDTRKEYHDEEDYEAVMESMRVLACMHVFHKKCIFKWFLSNSTCPVCRYNYAKSDGSEEEEVEEEEDE
jgi:hypothetical protein